MGKTGFEKFAEKNNAMSDLDIRIGKKAGEERGAEDRRRGESGVADPRKRSVKKLLVIPAELAEKLEEIRKDAYKASFTAVIMEALSDYVMRYEERRGGRS